MSQQSLPIIINILQRLTPSEGAPVLALFNEDIQWACIQALSKTTEETGLLINCLKHSQKSSLLKKLKKEDSSLFEQIRRHVYILDDFLKLSDKNLQYLLFTALKENDHMLLVKAFQNMEHELSEKIFNNLSERMTALIREDIAYHEGLEEDDIEKSRQQLLGLAKNLEDRAEIMRSFAFDPTV